MIPPPYAHQITALEKLKAGSTINANVFALLMEMRTAKSRPLIRDYWRLVTENSVDDFLLVAPMGCYLNWTQDVKNPDAEPGELEKWLTPAERSQVIVYAWAGRPVSLKSKKALQAFLDFSGPKRRAMLINVEALSMPGMARDVVLQYLKSRRIYWTIDESTCIMHESARTKFIQDARELAPYRRILTGLVAPENPLNVFQQFWFLDWRILGYRNYLSFQARYAITKKVDYRPVEEKEKKASKIKMILKYHFQTDKAWLVSPPNSAEEIWLTKKAASRGDALPDGRYVFWVSDWLALEKGLITGDDNRNTRGVTVVVAYRNQDELQSKIAAASYRVLKDDVFDLPPKLYEFRDVTMTDEQHRMYEEMRQFATTQFEDKFISVAMKMHQIQKMHEILCGHTKDEQGQVVDIPSNRVNELMTLLQDTSGKTIIWSPYPRSLEKIVDALKTAYGARSTVGFWGDTSTADRKDAKHRIQRAEDTRFIVANQAVGGEGNTWTAASLSIYFANSRKNKDRQQSEARPEGAGKRDRCIYIDLRVRHTIDEKWVKIIRDKLDLGAALTGDKWRAWLV